jgi:hypothetical protein
MVMTYNSLVNQVLDYLNRTDTDTANEIPNFIYQAEQRICRESKNIGLEVYVTNAFTPGVSVYAKPARWRRNITFNFGNGNSNNVRNQIQLRSYEYLRMYWSDPTQMAAPLFYSDYAYEHFLVAPTPDQAYPFELGYLELPEPLSVNVQTNWLTNYAPDVLLYATLLEAIPFLKNDERIPVWQQLYDRGIQSLNSQDDQRITDRGSNRSSD